MNKRGHVLNAVLLSIGLAVILAGPATDAIVGMVVVLGVPLTLGALLPDVDTAFGTHRKTFHHLALLVGLYVWPVVFGNLHYVWIGVLTHYVLDLSSGSRGMALLYPWPREYDLPLDIPYAGWYADFVAVAITAGELGIVYVAVQLDLPIVGLTHELIEVAVDFPA